MSVKIRILRALSNYRMYYCPYFTTVFQYGSEFKYFGEVFRYFKIDLSVYKVTKSEIPALKLEVIISGIGFILFTSKPK